jgi:hypothetical protein
MLFLPTEVWVLGVAACVFRNSADYANESRVLIYRNYPLETKNENITRALVFVHGINRDADNHFRTALAAAFLVGAFE